MEITQRLTRTTTAAARTRGEVRAVLPSTRPAQYSPNAPPSREHVFDTGRVDGRPPPPWEAGSRQSSTTAAPADPSTPFTKPVPITARICWEQDGEEQAETEALGWSGRDVYVRMPDRRYRFTACWLDAHDVQRR
jgi:hypothetical protein